MKKAKRVQNQQKENQEDEEDHVSWLRQDKDRLLGEDVKENQSTQKSKQDHNPKSDSNELDSVEKQAQIQFKRGQRVRLMLNCTSVVHIGLRINMSVNYHKQKVCISDLSTMLLCSTYTVCFVNVHNLLQSF